MQWEGAFEENQTFLDLLHYISKSSANCLCRQQFLPRGAPSRIVDRIMKIGVLRELELKTLYDQDLKFSFTELPGKEHRSTRDSLSLVTHE